MINKVLLCLIYSARWDWTKKKWSLWQFIPNKCILEFISFMVNTKSLCCQLIKDKILSRKLPKAKGAGRGGEGGLRGLQRIEYGHDWCQMKGESKGWRMKDYGCFSKRLVNIIKVLQCKHLGVRIFSHLYLYLYLFNWKCDAPAPSLLALYWIWFNL